MGQLIDVCSSAALSSTYQLDKYIKHTVPSTNHTIQSIIDNASTSLYRHYIVNAKAAGAVEIDDHGRKNIIYVASSGGIGCTFENGNFVRANNMIKVVIPSDPNKIHAFTDSSTNYSTAICLNCGKQVVY
ncbi:hypothetical protein EG832_10660 [bacterium]|nr:hypothetical protein [bacterium]